MICKSDYKYFIKAKNVASISDYKKIHVGCVAVYHGNIIGIGFNTNKTHPFQQYYNKYRKNNRQTELLPKLHAEINCLNSIRNLNINFAKVKLYIYRIRRDQPYGMSRPCPSCMMAIKDIGIKHIFYTSDNGYVYEQLSISN